MTSSAAAPRGHTPPVDNKHVAPGATQFTAEEVAMNRRSGDYVMPVVIAARMALRQVDLLVAEHYAPDSLAARGLLAGMEPAREAVVAAERAAESAPDLIDACNGLLGLIELLCARDDLTDSFKDMLRTHYRTEEARAAIKLAMGAP